MPDDVRVDHLTIKVGDDRPLAWELLEVDGDALAAGTFTARAQVRARPGGPLLHEWSSDGDPARARFVSRPGDDGAPDRWWVELLCDDSRTWTWERGLYDLYIVDSVGRAQPIAEGRVVVHRAITDG